jgi:hypothetical protein
MKQLQLKQVPGLYTVSKMISEFDVFSACKDISIFAMIRDEVETTVILEKNSIPNNMDLKKDENWAMFHLSGEFSFGESGIILSAIQPLSSNNIGVFILSTYSSDLLLIKHEDLDRAIPCLKSAGHTVIMNNILEG